MPRKYEIVYIFDSALDENQINETLNGLHALLKSPDNPEPIENLNHWGRRTLAYVIRKAEVGYYVVVQLTADGSLLPEFERAIKLNESILRYLLVLNEGEVPSPVPSPHADTDDVGRGKPAAAAGGDTTDKPTAAAETGGEATGKPTVVAETGGEEVSE